MTNQPLTENEVMHFLQNSIAQDLNLPTADIDVEMDLTDLGLSSVLIAFIEAELEDLLDIEIPPAMLFEMQNIKQAAVELIKQKKQQSNTMECAE
jgi:acyl carrier protein